jgi:phosphoribosylformimino-5-aminoimidazole carboxamide ribotide isomerase
MLGPGNDAAAEEALAAWPGGLQVGGGITPRNARRWIERGADKVIVTGFLFNDNYININNVKEMADTVGKEKLVIDLSCRKTESGYFVATNRWQTITTTPVNGDTLESLAAYCAEYLVHAADVEGRCRGIDETVVKLLADASPLPCTYAGGGRTIDDLDRIESLSNGRLDLTFGSALDIFGGNRVHYRACVAWNRNRSGDSPKNDKSVS